MRILFIFSLLLSTLPFLESCKRTERTDAYFLKEANIYLTMEAVPDTACATTVSGSGKKSFRFYLSDNPDSIGSDYIEVTYLSPLSDPFNIKIPKDSLKNIFIPYNADEGYEITGIASNSYKIKPYTYVKDGNLSHNKRTEWSDSTIIKNPHYYCLVIDPYNLSGTIRGYEQFTADSIRGVTISKTSF